jgi:dihydrofolate reductase
MRKIIVSEFMSLDGVIEAPEKWHFPFVTDDMMEEVMAQLLGADAMLYGRQTYQDFAGFWPTQTTDESGVAAKLNNAPKFVVSSTLEKADWNNSTLIIGMTGSATLIQSLLPTGLIDELRLLIHPIVVGSGKRLFKDGMESGTLKLIESKTYSGGVVLLVYQPESKAQ